MTELNKSVVTPTDCFICRKTCSGGNKNERNSRSFEMLMKFLSTEKLNSDSVAEANVDMCEGCGYQMNGFVELYREFEATRLSLDRCVRCLYDLMKVGKEFRRKEEGENEEKERLREDTMTKCAIKFGEKVPSRVKLKKSTASNDQYYHVRPLLNENGVKIEVDVSIEESPECKLILDEDIQDIQSESEGTSQQENLLENPFHRSISNSSSSFSSDVIPISETIALKMHPSTSSMHYEGEDPDFESDDEVEILSHQISTRPPLPSSFENYQSGALPPFQFPSTSTYRPSMPSPNFRGVRPPGGVCRDPCCNPMYPPPEKEKVYTCRLCREVFPNWGLFLQHRKTYHQSGQLSPTSSDPGKNPQKARPFLCYYCCQPCESKQYHRWHMIRVHFMDFYSSVIPQGASEQHILAVTKALVDRHKVYSPIVLGCPYCPKWFRNTSLLRVHILDEHFDRVLLALRNPHDFNLQPVMVTHELPRSLTSSFPEDNQPHPPPVSHPGRRKRTKSFNAEETHQLFHSSQRTPPSSTTSSYEYSHHSPHGRPQNTSSNLNSEEALPPPLISPPSHSKTLTSEQAQTFSSANPCSMCNKNFPTPLTCRLHSVVSHPAAMLEKDLPQGTTSYQVEASLSRIMAAIRPHPSGNIGCSICGTDRDTEELMKFHILTNHIDCIVEGLPEQIGSVEGGAAIIVAESDIIPLPTPNKDHSKEGNVMSCPYCDKSFPNNNNYSRHIMLNHPFHFYKKELPPETSEDHVEDAIKEVLCGERVVVENYCTRYGCPYCETTYWSRRELRIHVINYHFNFIIAKLRRRNNLNNNAN